MSRMNRKLPLPFHPDCKGPILFLFLLLFAACRPASPAPPPPPRSAPVTPLPGPISETGSPEIDTAVPEILDEDLLPTAVMIVETPDAHLMDLPYLEAPTPAPDPLRFVFPTPGPAPVSAWRPPLYPTPWAPSPYDHFYFTRPIAADEVNWPLWDYRYGGSFFADTIHTGVDIPARKGTPVLAAGSGKIVWTGYGAYRGTNDPGDPYGLAVIIQHDFGYQGETLHTLYGHLSQVEVVKGQYVDTGQVIGISGDTGHVTGPHLHFEVRVGKNDYFTTRNPELWLAPPQGWGVLAGRVMDSAGQLKTEQSIIVSSKTSGQNWLAKSYGDETINNDPYYRENVVISDLPEGKYEVRIPYQGIEYKYEIEIQAGLVNYFTFRGYNGFGASLPPTPGADFIPGP